MTNETTSASISINTVWDYLSEVLDPEVPVLSVVELGIVRKVEFHNEEIIITITPTYSGCPATRVIEADIRDAIERAGIPNVSIEHRIDPPWTTDWITERGRKHLLEAGISPPACWASTSLTYEADVVCPHCGSHNTRVLSSFGSTPCKALWRCSDCLEPFDYFKPH